MSTPWIISGSGRLGVGADIGAGAGRFIALLGRGPALRIAVFVLSVILLLSFANPANALKAIELKADQDRIEITNLADYYDGRGDRLQVDTAPGTDGISARIVVRASVSSSNPNWMVFALHNPTSATMERWLTAVRYNIIGSGTIWPDLDARRLEAVTPSIGVIPERIKNDQTDIFQITLPPGKTITFVAELASETPARIYLWKPLSFAQKARDKQLFNGIMLGIVGLLGIFLIAVFAANHKAIFPSAALVTWCVLAYLCVEFGFWHKLFQLRAEDNALYRAAAEASVAASLVIFLFTFLRLNVWHGFIRMVFAVWIVAQLGLIFTAVLDPKLAATFARLSVVAIGLFGGLLALFLALRGQDRALALIPTWLLFCVWIFGAAMAMNGRLSGEVAHSGLIAGLVLLVLLIGFTITQFAFRSVEPYYGATPNQLQLRSLAIDGAGSAVWEWNARRDEIKVSPILEALLGLNIGELSTKVENFAKYLHPSDRERLRLSLFSAKEKSADQIHLEFRMRHTDNSYRWFELEAASVPGADRQALRCVGLMRDVTDSRRSTERLMHDAVHDSLTGLPNRELFMDRLATIMKRLRSDAAIRPKILFIDVDKFKSINSSFGLIVGDSLLLTVARRLNRHIGDEETLARVGGDQFAILLIEDKSVQELAALAENVRQALRTPINIAGQEIVLTVSIGVAVYDGEQHGDSDLLHEAEIAMYRAKRAGTDRIEIFKPEMRNQKDERIAIESELRQALEHKQLTLLYQPIIYLPTEELAGFEALVRWDHPKLGRLNPSDFVPVAEETDLIARLGSFVLGTATAQAARWQKDLPRPDNPLFVSVNVSSRQLFRQDLVQEMRLILSRAVLPKGSLRLEVTESLVMENPEQATQMLDLLKSAGAELSLDDFGTGYSSLAYLQRFPFDTIKIDKELVQGSSENGAEQVIVRSIVALAHELDKKVVAEGVETAEDVGFLRSIGCGYAQGFYYGEPMGARDVRKLLRAVAKSERRLLGGGLFRGLTKKKPDIKPVVTPVRVPKTAAKPVQPVPPPYGQVAPAAAGAVQAEPGQENWLKRREAANRAEAVARQAAAAAAPAAAAPAAQAGPTGGQAFAQAPAPGSANPATAGANAGSDAAPAQKFLPGGQQSAAPAIGQTKKRGLLPWQRPRAGGSSAEPAAPGIKDVKPVGGADKSTAPTPATASQVPLPVAAKSPDALAKKTGAMKVEATPPPDFSTLPPAIAASLARLAGGGSNGKAADAGGGDKGAKMAKDKTVAGPGAKSAATNGKGPTAKKEDTPKPPPPGKDVARS